MIGCVVVGSQGSAKLSGKDTILSMVVHSEVSPDEEGDVASCLIR